MVQFLNNSRQAVERGDLVAIAKEQTLLAEAPSDVMPTLEANLTTTAYDTRVCGVVVSLYVAQTPVVPPEAAAEATRPTRASGAKKGQRPQAKRVYEQSFTADEIAKLDHSKVESGQIGMIATHGFQAECKVDADIAPVRAGDLLTTSTTAGHAQKVLDVAKATGSIVGKALGSLSKGKGKIPILVLLQ